MPYRDCLIALFDIIGFANLIAKSPASKAEAVLQAVYDAASYDDSIFAYGGNTVNFSDTVVRFVPLDAAAGEGVLVWELLNLVHVQSDMAYRGILLRGGVTVGKLEYVVGTAKKPSLLFGPGLVR